ncbi:efflux RND transporter permease subunit [Aestuariibacter sp. AA17]|uniref:Efflux RND transporter permease subunit n=1 Tax=Fluctibacter corallii TaxID=2984329 RepID=A0ABT3A5K0_9ALTE|nr:efflux RND transporter permease subunit [Aestuariibacter sp. AA17]MCV2883924.1 efflux RND transporter permease subunit [Aestuariibacter sp. AA17]
MSFVKTSVNRPVTVWMITFAVLLFGMVSLSRLAINLLPDLSYPSLTIRTDYAGAAPAEIEQLVSKPIEEAVGVVKGVRTVKSVSKAGRSDVLLEFEWGTEMEFASLEVREKLDVINLPLDVKKPLILRFNPSLDPVLQYGFGGNTEADALTPTALKRMRTFAEEEIKRKLESVDGVASVQVGGGLESEVHVLIDQQKSSQLNIPISDIVTRLKEENINAAGGRVEDGSQEYLVRTLNQFDSLQDMRNVFIATRQGRHIRLGDIATITDAHKERSSVTRVNSIEGVEIAIYKEGDANTVHVAKQVEARLQQLHESLPEEYSLTLIRDQSQFIGNAISEVKRAAIIGGVLSMFVLYLFLRNIWPTLIISISIPVSIIATFNLMYANDISLNIMSLGGIALAIGLLVDNSIVVLENIDRHKQINPAIKEAATQGTKEVSMAIFASTLTTMAVFFPLVFVEGIAGQLFSDQALTVTFALAASLIVALSLIPMLAAREKVNAHTDAATATQQEVDPSLLSRQYTPTHPVKKALYLFTWPVRKLFVVMFYYLPLMLTTTVQFLVTIIGKGLSVIFRPVTGVFNWIYTRCERGYSSALLKAMQAKYIVIGGVVTLSLASLLLLPRLGMNLLPSLSQGEFFVEVNMPTGSQLQVTDTVLKDLATYAETLEGVDRTYSLAGTGSLMNASPSQGGDDWGKLNIVMADTATPAQTSNAKAALRQYLQNKPGVISQFGQPELFSFATPLEIHVVGYNLKQLQAQGDNIVERLSENARFADVSSSLQAGKPELKVVFDHSRLAQLGLTAADVSNHIASQVGGEIASRYNVNDRQIDILVRAIDSQRDSVADINSLIINPGQQPPIPLSAVADVSKSIGPSEITRVGQQRVVIISSNLAYGNLGEATEEVKALLADVELPPNLSLTITGQSEEMQNSFQSLQFALLLAVFMVYLVMASQFESLLHPFLILFTVPLACAGSIYGLYLTNTSLSVVVFIGLIMLAGIVVNNAIVLIDRINQLRANGAEKHAAIIEAAQSRLRPIMMTTLTTTLGLLPMAIGLGDGAEMRTPMAITVIFGLLFASILTLFFIPAIYSVFDRKRYEGAQPDTTKIEEPVYG